jgi:hypothetical protein
MPAAASGSLEQSASTSCKTPFEVAGLDRPHKGVDHRPDRRRLARRDHAAGECGGERLHRGGDVRGTLDRRHREFNRAFAIRFDGAFEAQRNAVGSPASASSTALRVEASPSPASSNVAGGIAGSALGEPPVPVPHPLFPLFYLVEIRHRQPLQC